MQVRDMMKRLAAAELSNVLRGDTLPANGEEGPLSRPELLKDMFGHAKTTAGRLFLIKEMLQLPVFFLKAFAGTKSGLEVLNTWILVRIIMPRFVFMLCFRCTCGFLERLLLLCAFGFLWLGKEII